MAGTTNIGEGHPLPDTGARRQGRYVLGELLGRGGMAEVFAGQAMGSHGFQKPVAIKRLLPELANDHVFVERLIGEAKLLISLQHGNIVSVLDLARDGDDVFLVMEFVDGPSLRQLLKARGSRGLTLGVATYIVQAAAAGLEFAHARPGGAVIHADISPSNLLLTTSGEVRVADFGIARREGGGAGVVEGKWAYMAPEQARGEPLTPRSDVFALGVVLYELITGQHPFGKQVTEHEREAGLRVVPPRVLKSSIPPGLDAICMRALAYEPHDRYARMQQLFDALNEERFGNGWREGANDLAGAIREIKPGALGSSGPKTQVTDRPLTIVTRSLISQSHPAPKRPGSPRLVEVAPPAATPTHSFDSAARTAMVEPQHVQQAPAQPMAAPMPMPQMMMPMQQLPAMMPIPAAVLQLQQRAEQQAQQQVPQRLSHNLLPNGELVSVHGGNTMTGTGHLAIDSRNYKWTIAVFGIAALLGVIAAVAIQLAPEDGMENAPAVQPTLADTTPKPVDPPTSPAKPAEPAPTAPTVQQVAPPPVGATTPTTATNPPPAPATEGKPDTETKPPGEAVATTAPNVSSPATASQMVEPKTHRDTKDGAKKQFGAHVSSTGPKHSGEVVGRKPAPGEDGWIRVTTEDSHWANIYVENVDTHQRQRREIPDGRFQLPPGNYRVNLKNTLDGTHAECGVVTLEAGKVVPLHAYLEDGACDRR